MPRARKARAAPLINRPGAGAPAPLALAPPVAPPATVPQPPNAMGGPRPQPITAPTGLPYGEHQALVAQQHQVPLPGAGGGAGAPAAPPNPLEVAKAFIPPPATAIGIGRPTERPGEPATAGVGIGAGPGPGALNGPGFSGSALASGAAVLNLLGERVDAETRKLRDAINASLANQGAP